jgi:prepilin peptidase CpaA
LVSPVSAPEQFVLAAGCACAAAGLAWAAVSDISRYEIPHRACALVAGGYLLALPALGLTPWLVGLGLGAAAFGLGVVVFAAGWLGGGDVKLLAAALPWAGLGLLRDFTLATALTGAGLGLAMLTPVRRLMPAGPQGAGEGLKQPMPYGVAIAAGGLVVLALRLAGKG